MSIWTLEHGEICYSPEVYGHHVWENVRPLGWGFLAVVDGNHPRSPFCIVHVNPDRGWTLDDARRIAREIASIDSTAAYKAIEKYPQAFACTGLGITFSDHTAGECAAHFRKLVEHHQWAVSQGLIDKFGRPIRQKAKRSNKKGRPTVTHSHPVKKGKAKGRTVQAAA